MLRQTLADWSNSGKTVPLSLAGLALDDERTDQQVAREVAASFGILAGRANATSVVVDDGGVASPWDFYNVSWASRRTWLQSMEDEHTLGGWLRVFEGVMDFGEHSAVIGEMPYFRAWDAAVLYPIQLGIQASYENVPTTYPAALKWKEFFDQLQRQQEDVATSGSSSVTDAQLKYLWGDAEQAGIEQGMDWAREVTQPNRLEIGIVDELKKLTDRYREAVRTDGWFVADWQAMWGASNNAPLSSIPFPWHPDPRIDRVPVAGAALFFEPQMIIMAAKRLASSDPTAALAAYMWSDDPSALGA